MMIFRSFNLVTTARSPSVTPNCFMNSGGKTMYGIFLASTYVPGAVELPPALCSEVVET